MPGNHNEAFSRVLIDKALEFSGWNLLDSHQVRFELNDATGRADYVLGGQRGPLCVLEAKREDATDTLETPSCRLVPLWMNLAGHGHEGHIRHGGHVHRSIGFPPLTSHV